MSNDTVAAALAPQHDWKSAYAFVETEARKILDVGVAGGGSISTTVLADMIYSPNEAYDPKVRKRVFQALKACANHGLKRYVTMGEPEQVGVVMNARRLKWHAPRPDGFVEPCCPTCKRPL